MSKSQYKRIVAQTQPSWVCSECGNKYGHGMPEGHVCTMHNDVCGVCGKQKAVTQPRDFGYLKPEWRLAKAGGSAL